MKCVPALPQRRTPGGPHVSVYTFDPLQDPRWEEFCQRAAGASIFHTRGWLTTLQRTYGYQPVVFTTSAPGGALDNGVVFCRVSSWLTGRRMISLPFADHCEPLVACPEAQQEISAALQKTLRADRLKHIELRPLSAGVLSEFPFRQDKTFYFHWLSLRPSLEDIFRRFHKDSIQRRVRKAERVGLVYEQGRSAALLQKFYRMIAITRRRHHLPPQPIEWFRNLIACVGEKLTIHVASHRQQPVAGILTLHYRDTVVYKYGGSDAQHHNLGGMPLLLWKAIEAARRDGAQHFDFGRSDKDNEGLVRFKDQWGSTRTVLTYGKLSNAPERATRSSPFADAAQRLFFYMPDFLSAAAGRLLYRHIG